ncbi:MAG: CsbD family protein [Roseiarcus sp.]
MKDNRIVGIGHQVKGALEEGLGKVIGDAKLVADGTAERAVGAALNADNARGDFLTGIDTDRILGVGHQLKGALLQGLGNLVGDAKLEADGIAERQAGKAQNATGSARDVARENRDAATDASENVATPDSKAKPQGPG